MPRPVFSSALSTAADSRQAEEAALRELEAGLAGATPDLVCAFATHHHGERLEELGPRLARATGAAAVLGCTGQGVVGGSREVEREPGLALWAASLPDTRVAFFEVGAFAGPEDEEVRFSALPPVVDAEEASLLLLADPFTFPMDRYLERLAEDLPDVPATGGMASGGSAPGQNLLVTAQGLRESGAIGVVLEGAVTVRAVVSQGCRPVGKPWVVTDAVENRVRRLGGRPALEVLMETWRSLSDGEKELLQRMPFVGLAHDASKTRFERGDFLVRNVLGVHQKEGWIAVGDLVRRGQTIQFLVRDADSAGEDLRFLLAHASGGPLDGAAGALLFTCTGRGTHMFPAPHHDASCVREVLHPDLPLAGFFANGEIGPVGGRNFLHGFTASVAVFRERGA